MNGIGLTERGYNLIARKPIKLPEELIYEYQKLEDGSIFRMFSLKNQRNTCDMFCYKSEHFMEKDKTPSLHIRRLESTPKNKGLGSKMIEFAKNYSESIGCEGRITLMATHVLDKDGIAPHTFYRKLGFNTRFIGVNKKIDEFIEAGKIGTRMDFDGITMYYPPVEEINEFTQHELSLLEAIRKWSSERSH